MISDKGEADGEEPYAQKSILTGGPDGIEASRLRSGGFHPEAAGDLCDLCRAAPKAPHPAPRRSYVGEIGWGWRFNQLLNGEVLFSNVQIKKTEFRAALEDRVAQRFLNTQ